MSAADQSGEPVVVVGGGLAGLAAAARLAKAGHAVELHERRPALGGRWRPQHRDGQGTVDAAPAMLTFPAPWRDLFRKSGRPLEAELARSGHALLPAGPTRYRFADGSGLALPAERGAQHAALAAAYGEAAARRWRDLLDGLDEVWQLLRPRGLEAELRGREQLGRTARAGLWARRTVADLAAGLGEPHLAAVLRSTAHRAGSRPERAPALVAVELAVTRTFGRWRVAALPGAADGRDDGRSSVLVEALSARLAQRRVAVHLGSEVQGLELAGGRVVGVRTRAGSRPASAVVVTTDPWQLVGTLLPGPAGRRLRRHVRPLSPAVAPEVTWEHRDEPCTEVTETVELSADGVPDVGYARPCSGGTLVTRHAWSRGRPDPSAGAAWDGFGSWRHRPPVTTEVPGLWTASAASPGGASPSAVVLSAALAAAGCSAALAPCPAAQADRRAGGRDDPRGRDPGG